MSDEFDELEYQSALAEIEGFIFSGERDYPINLGEGVHVPTFSFTDGNRYYLSKSRSKKSGNLYCSDEYIRENNEIYDAYEEPDLDDLAAYWHEKEDSQ